MMTIYTEWKEKNFTAQFCYENFVQIRTMKRIRDVRDQLIGLMERVDIECSSSSSDHDAIRKCILAGFFYNVARLKNDTTYQTIKNPLSVYIHPSSGLCQVAPRFVVYHELVFTSKEYMRTV